MAEKHNTGRPKLPMMRAVEGVLHETNVFKSSESNHFNGIFKKKKNIGSVFSATVLISGSAKG